MSNWSDYGYDPFLRRVAKQGDGLSFMGDAYSLDGLLEGGISGTKISGGIIKSSDGRTRIDLEGKQIIINDGSDDRVLIGFQDGGF